MRNKLDDVLIVSTIATISERGMLDEVYNLCDECIEKLYDWMKDNEE